MAKVCPKCTADTEPVEEDTKRFCIHEKILIVAFIGSLAIAVGYFGLP